MTAPRIPGQVTTVAKTLHESKTQTVIGTLATALMVIGSILWLAGVLPIGQGQGKQQTVLKTCRGNSCHTTTITTTPTTTTTPITISPPSSTDKGIAALRIGSNDLFAGQLLGRYSVVILNAWQASYVPQIHAENAATKVLMYVEGPKVQTTVTSAAGELTSGSGITTYDVTLYGHPEWLLRDASGRPIPSPGYTYYDIGNIGLASFRQQWAQNTINRAKHWGFDGVFIDDILSQRITPTPEYTTQTAWRAAMLGFVQSVGPTLKAAGLYVAANIGSWNEAGGQANNDGSYAAGWWTDVLPSLDAGFQEYFLQNPNNQAQMYDNQATAWTGFWAGWTHLIDVAQAADRAFLGAIYGGNTNDARNRVYGKASFLLKWNGGPSAFIYDFRASDSWNTDWTADIGAPLAPMYQVGSGFRRDYTNGTVYVNPTLSTQTLGSVTLAPTSAAILRG